MGFPQIIQNRLLQLTGNCDYAIRLYEPLIRAHEYALLSDNTVARFVGQPNLIAGPGIGQQYNPPGFPGLSVAGKEQGNQKIGSKVNQIGGPAVMLELGQDLKIVGFSRVPPGLFQNFRLDSLNVKGRGLDIRIPAVQAG